MATTTPNYGWSVPTSTDLVKDGATAIETLGDSADATVKALNPETTLGDLAYRSATANVKTRLGIGTTGQVLTVSGGVPAWAAPAVSTSGFTYINSYSFSNVASLSMSSIFSATYDYYRIVTDFSMASAADFLNIRFRTGSTDNTTSNYHSAIIKGVNGTADATYDNAASGFTRTVLCGDDSTIISFDVTNPFSSSIKTSLNATFGCFDPATRFGTGSGAGLFNATTSFDGMTLIPPANFTGRAKVYGYSNS